MAIKKINGLGSTSILDEFATKFRSNGKFLQSLIDQMIENFHIYHEKSRERWKADSCQIFFFIPFKGEKRR